MGNDAIQLTINIMLLLIGLAGVVAAFMALSTWKKQRKAHLAEQIIIYAHMMNEFIEFVRNGSLPNGGYEGYAHIQVRLHSNSKLFAEYNGLLLKSSLHFPSYKKWFDVFGDIVLEIQYASEDLRNNRPKTPKKLEQLESVIYKDYGEDDKIRNRMKKAILELEKGMRKYL